MSDNEVSRLDSVSQFLQKASERWWFRVGFPIFLYIVTSSAEASLRNIGLGEAIIKLPLFLWRRLQFNFIIPVWLYVLSVSLPFIFYYIVKRRAFVRENVSANKQEKRGKTRKDDTPEWWEYKEDIIKGNRYRWDYENYLQLEIKNLQQVCNKCGCELNWTLIAEKEKEKKKQEKTPSETLFSSLSFLRSGGVCPNCSSVYESGPIETIKKLIRHNIRTGKYEHSKFYHVRGQN
jgi:hypothetical protein